MRDRFRRDERIRHDAAEEIVFAGDPEAANPVDAHQGPSWHEVETAGILGRGVVIADEFETLQRGEPTGEFVAGGTFMAGCIALLEVLIGDDQAQSPMLLRQKIKFAPCRRSSASAFPLLGGGEALWCRATRKELQDGAMAEVGIPHFHNDPGMSTILLGAREFMCIGAKPPFDHPHVFLDMGRGRDRLPLLLDALQIPRRPRPAKPNLPNASMSRRRKRRYDLAGARGSGLR